jgi:hypothetical protein
MKKITSFLAILLLLSVALPKSSKAQQLPVGTEIQLQSNWCWAACSKAILDYYGYPNNTQ